MTRHVDVGGGRAVAVYELQESDGDRVVVLCHPAPGSGGFDPDPEQTRLRHVRLIAVDRPGYGRSDPLPQGGWATVASAADDLACVLETMGVERAGVAGWSAGGRIALALAARRPDLIDRVVVVATPAPDDEVPWYPDDVRRAIDGLRGLDPSAVTVALQEQLRQVVPAHLGADDALDLLGASAADAGVLRRPGARDRLASMLESAFTQGVLGLATDMAGFSLQPWGFEPRDVKAKTLLLYGSKDPIAAQRHATWWDRRLPDSRVEMAPGAGHLSVISRWRRALSHLAPGTLRRK